ncbi:MAG: sugar transferase [Lachnospiraceae bacterium]|nr:sugar transferase [Lachnospiraceae bacterium]
MCEEKQSQDIDENINISAENLTESFRLTEKQKKYLPVKRAIDIVLSSGAIVVFSPLLAGLALAIKIDSPGPVLFKQKRVGKDKELFEIWKFRTMRTDTPKDMPTHQLNNPDAYITRTGRIMRRLSLDELPQLFNILSSKMSVIGPRPALWNQDDLIAERDKYGANNVIPGLTGWAQINGRDELEIPVKAAFDGEYVEKMGLMMDIKCFLGTVGSVLSSDGVVEGGTGELEKDGRNSNNTIGRDKVVKNIKIGAGVVIAAGSVAIGIVIAVLKFFTKRDYKITQSKEKYNKLTGVALITAIISTIAAVLYKRSKRQQVTYKGLCGDIEFAKLEHVDKKMNGKQKKILITGANSYIGVSVEKWLNDSANDYVIETIDMIDEGWKNKDFSMYDVVYHVAGIAHADVGSVTEEQKKLYYKVNTDLAFDVAQKAKADGVKQFIFMSSMIVYSGCDTTAITKTTEPKPLNFYGDSKWQADQKVRSLSEDKFKVVVLRPPMIYGKGSKGNYPELAKLASKLPVFPEVKNKRSMLHIDNLCEFVKLMIDNEESGIFFPQNEEYTNTSEMVQMIATVKNHNIIMIPGMNLPVKMMEKIPGKIGGLATKAFGNSTYDMGMSEYKDNYRVRTLAESIALTENNK